MRSLNLGRTAAILMASASISACAPLQEQFPVLSLLAASPKPPPLEIRAETAAMPRYRPVSYCRYSGRLSMGGREEVSDQRLVVRQVRDKLLVTSTIGSEQSTALISASGRKYDFNAADPSGGRMTPEEFARVRESNPTINNTDIYLPAYEVGSASPGQAVAVLRGSTGAVQAAFVYKGLVTYRGRDSVLFEIKSAPDGSLGRTIGFSIVDRYRALPVLFAASGRPAIRVEQVECRD